MVEIKVCKNIFLTLIQGFHFEPYHNHCCMLITIQEALISLPILIMALTFSKDRISGLDCRSKSAFPFVGFMESFARQFTTLNISTDTGYNTQPLSYYKQIFKMLKSLLTIFCFCCFDDWEDTVVKAEFLLSKTELSFFLGRF